MPRGKKTGGRRGRPTALASTSTAELRRELERRQSMFEELVRQREQLDTELHELQGLFGEASSMPARRRGPGRPPGSKNRTRHVAAGKSATQLRKPVGGNKTNLVTALKQTLTGKTMSVTDVAQQVQRNGYKSKSANFRTIVNQALIANPQVFRKVSRGEYTAR